MNAIQKLSDQELVARIEKLNQVEISHTLEILFHLNELDGRRLYLELGYSSLFAYCTQKLGYSDGMAAKRIRVARCLRQFPRVLEMLEKGETTLSAVADYAQVLKEENSAEVLKRVKGKSRREVEEVVLRAQAKPARPRESIKAVAVKAAKQSEELFSTQVAETSTVPGDSTEINKLDEIEMLFELKVSVNEKCMAKLREVQALISRGDPRAKSLENVLEKVLEGYLEKHSPVRREERRAKRKNRVVKKRTVSKVITRNIPVPHQDKVWVRDEAQCTFRGTDGKRCDAREGLQFDHVQPFGLGGDHSVENLRLLCGKHNRLMAEKVYRAQECSLG